MIKNEELTAGEREALKYLEDLNRFPGSAHPMRDEDGGMIYGKQIKAIIGLVSRADLAPLPAVGVVGDASVEEAIKLLEFVLPLMAEKLKEFDLNGHTVKMAESFSIVAAAYRAIQKERDGLREAGAELLRCCPHEFEGAPRALAALAMREALGAPHD